MDVRPPSVVICAGGAKEVQGLVSGHAYSVLDCVKLVSGAKLIQLRNPWGAGEWSGAYSDKDASTARWMETAGLSMLGRKVDADDGKFWMSVGDFVANFSNMSFVGANKYVANTTMDFHEGYGLCGPCRGCVGGTASYWCGFQGCRLTCAPERRGTLSMLRDAGLVLKAGGWYVSRYHGFEANGMAGGRHNKAGWADNILNAGPDDDRHGLPPV
mmetsp:Transcript_9885/g.30672  ORF Transcript_9885/g.30672 Transcript_9885/m.30672 type:complete len:214 (-) Transcript_9885:45-686(-)